jgi:hypothetical protein
MQPAEAPDHMKRADEREIFVCASGRPDSGKSLTRPVLEIPGMLGTAASLVTAADVGGAKGACCPSALPNKPGRSQVENGAVNGTMTRTTSQEAKNLGSIALGMYLPASAKHAPRLAVLRNLPNRSVFQRLKYAKGAEKRPIAE